MLRTTLLAGLMAMAAASACKGSGSSAPEVQPGATVGKVIEISGAVTATRGTATRTLDATSTVSGDDLITTAADGRVRILLAHNNAQWDLGPNKHEKVADSMAWQLAKVDTPAAAVDETSTAAGRHAERSAATGESAAPKSDESARAPAAVAAAPEAPSTGAPAPGGGAPKGGAPAPAAATAPPTAQPTPPPPPEKTAKATATKTSGTTRAPADLQQALGGAASDARGISAAGGEGDGEDIVGQMKAVIARERSAMAACVAASGKDSTKVVLHVEGSKTTITLPDGGSDADKACFAKIAARIKLTSSGPTSFAVTIKK